MGVTSGTKLPNGTVVLVGDPQQMHSIRCMKCHGKCSEITRPDGKLVYKCPHCGREWGSKKF